MTDHDRDYWERVGTEHPYWGVLSQERFRGADLTPELKGDFLAEGVRDIEFVTAMIRRHVDGEFAPQSALDFGCGVGRLVLAMAPIVPRVLGVDASGSMLEHARQNAAQRGAEHVRFAMEIPDEMFDWINSYIVFQHIQPRKGIPLLQDLLARLAVGGVISLHFTIYRDSRIWYRGLQESEFGRYDGEQFVNFSRGELRDMPIYEYDLSEVVCHLFAHHIRALSMRHIDHQGLHGVWIVGRRE